MVDTSSRPLRQRLLLVWEVAWMRARFILVLLAVALLIGKWDTIKNYWDKLARPRQAALLSLPEDEEFYCPMDPQVTRPGFDANGRIPNCPICGMPLSRRKKGEAQPLPPGITGRVQISPERVHMAGIQTVEVVYRPLVKEITTVGNVTYDESRLSRVVSRTDGYVEKLYVDRTYATVKKGDPLAEIYSPELYSSAQVLVLAAKGQAEASMLESTRKRLELFGVDDKEIDAMIRSGVASPRLVIRSPQAGCVISKQVVAGARIESGMTLLEIADLSQVWIEAEVYENDIPLLHAGQKVEARVDALGGRVFTGTVTAVYPRVEASTRTNRVRCEVPNADQKLRPGMYATVRVETSLADLPGLRDLAAGKGSDPKPAAGMFLAVPELSVIDTGDKQIVYVERQPGLFEGVEVQLGPRCQGEYPVIRGLHAGERVAAAGAFLVDAETRLNPSAAAEYFGATGGSKVAAGPVRAPAPAAVGSALEIKRPSATMLQQVALLAPEDRAIAETQVVCPITGEPLGSMGRPVKLLLNNQVVFLCCKGCVVRARSNPEQTLQRVKEIRASVARERGRE